MHLFTNILSAFFKNEDDKKRLHKVVIPSFIIHFFAAILTLVFIFVMTRSLGSRQYGIYTYSFSIVFIIVNLAITGIGIVIIRETPSLLSKGKNGLWKGLYKWSAKLTLLTCIFFTLITATFIILSTYYLHILKESAYTIPLITALAAIPFSCIMNYYAANLRSQNKIVLSLLPDNIIKPLLFLFFVGITFFFSSKLNVKTAILFNTTAFGGAALFAAFAFYKTTKLKGIKADYDVDAWKKSLKALFLLTLIMGINSKIDILMLGYLKDSSQVGIYSVADMIASKLIIFSIIINQISAPSISRSHTLEQKQKLQEMITKISRWVMIITFPVFVFIIIFSKWILSYFGLDFVGGQMALIIISTGQIINIAYGPVGIFALMTGNQKFNIVFTAITIFLNIFLNLILTPTLGINGTAIATACAIITFNTGMFLSIRKKTGIRTWIFG